MVNKKGTQDAQTKKQAKHGFKNSKKQGKGQPTPSLNSVTAVPMLRFGVSSNFDHCTHGKV
jgi:hypothetical protein